jgi:gamma-glutamylcyclotransferase (GGCT)/AIG2-like uncharacterized protein YtfP
VGRVPELLFVYGSLLSGLENEHRLDPRYARAPARTRGVLFAICGGRYPQLDDGDGWVEGELVTLASRRSPVRAAQIHGHLDRLATEPGETCGLEDPGRVLAELDRFEGVASGLYRRIRREVFSAGAAVTAWTYVAPARCALDRELLAGGDWRRFAAPGHATRQRRPHRR